MRKAFTVGITRDNAAVLILDHTSSLREHKNALRDPNLRKTYSEVFLLESSRANKKKRFGTDNKVGVDLGATLLVSEQSKKKMDAVRGEAGRGSEKGGVNWDAVRLISQQGSKGKKGGKGKKSPAELTDEQGGLEIAARGKGEGKINFKAALTVAEQQGRKPAPKKLRKINAAGKRVRTTAKKSAAAAEKEALAKGGQHDKNAKADLESSTDSGPTL